MPVKSLAHAFLCQTMNHVFQKDHANHVTANAMKAGNIKRPAVQMVLYLTQKSAIVIGHLTIRIVHFLSKIVVKNLNTRLNIRNPKRQLNNKQ